VLLICLFILVLFGLLNMGQFRFIYIGLLTDSVQVTSFVSYVPFSNTLSTAKVKLRQRGGRL
jgi:hypothetical protein